MNIGTRCSSVDAFVASYSRYLVEHSMFVVTREPRPLGVATPFVFKLADGTPVLCGVCVISQLWMDETNPFKRPGIWLTITRLNADSFPVLLRMQEAPVTPAREALLAQVKTKFDFEAKLAKDWDLETEARPPAMLTDLIAQMGRAKGGDEILPANPLSLVGDEALEDMLGHSLSVKTGSFITPEDQAFDETPLPRASAALSPPSPVVATSAAASASVSAPIAVKSAPPPPAVDTKPTVPRPTATAKPKVQIPPIRPLATPPAGVPVVQTLAGSAVPPPIVDTPSKALRAALPVVKAVATPGRERPTDAMVPLFFGPEKSRPQGDAADPPINVDGLDEYVEKPDAPSRPVTASAPPAAPVAGVPVVPATGSASLPGLPSVPDATTARNYRTEQMSPLQAASLMFPSAAPVASDSPSKDSAASDSPVETKSSTDSIAEAAGADVSSDAHAVAPRAARDTIGGRERGTDEVPALITDSPRETGSVDGVPRDERTVDAMAVIANEVAAPGATSSTEERAERAMATDAMAPLVVEPSAMPIATESIVADSSAAVSTDEPAGRTFKRTDAVEPLVVAAPVANPPPTPVADPLPPVAPPAPASASYSTMPPVGDLVAPVTTAELASGHVHANASEPPLTAPAHLSGSAWSRLASWSRQGPSRVVIAIAVIAIALLAWKLVASKPIASSPAAAPAVERDPKASVPSSESTELAAGDPAGSVAPAGGDVPTTFGAGSAEPAKVAIAETGTTDGAAAGSAEPKTVAGPAPSHHTLYISTYPQGAEVFMNGKRLGISPVIAKMKPNTPVKLSVEKRGFQTVTKKYTSTQPKSGIRFKLVKSCTGLNCM